MGIIDQMKRDMRRTRTAPLSMGQLAKGDAPATVQSWYERAKAFYLGHDEFHQFRLAAAREDVSPDGLTYRGLRVFMVTERNHYAVIYEPD